MIYLCLYLWACQIIGCLTALSIIRHVNWFDILIAVAFPVVFPVMVIVQIWKRIKR